MSELRRARALLLVQQTVIGDQRRSYAYVGTPYFVCEGVKTIEEVEKHIFLRIVSVTRLGCIYNDVDLSKIVLNAYYSFHVAGTENKTLACIIDYFHLHSRTWYINFAFGGHELSYNSKSNECSKKISLESMFEFMKDVRRAHEFPILHFR
jgi:hypothetical protein